MFSLSRRLVNNHIFFQHPDLIRILRVHENVMAVMMNTLGRRAQTQGESQVAEGAEGTQGTKEKVGLSQQKMISRLLMIGEQFFIIQKQ